MVLKNVYKKYDDARNYSVTDFNLSIKDREFIVFAGPSGYGKSAVLQMIAGLEDISEGELNIGRKIMNGVTPKDRDIAMVFRSYALHPHMTVYGDMAFDLRLCKYNKTNIKECVDNAAEILELTEYLKRKPTALSDGQRQRVALGRAIARDAKVFLMDEPLSNSDAKLYVAMRAEVTKLHQRLETTTIYVIHDQTEAMAVADQIVVMKDGFIQQIGASREVYDTPVNMFVTGFIGSPAMNFFNVTLKNGVITDRHGLRLHIPERKNKVLVEKGYEGKEVIFGICPEGIYSEQVALEASSEAIVKSEVVASELLGTETMLCAKTGSTELTSEVDARDFHKPGEIVELAFNISKGRFFDKEIEQVIELP